MLVIKNAEVHTMTNQDLERADILINGGKIQAVEENLSTEGCQIIDAEGLIALPGLVDAHTHIGGMNFSQPKSLDDFNEMTRSVVPEAQALYGTDVTSQDFAFAYRSGITTVGITPGSGNLINGWAFAAKTFGDNIFDMVLKNPMALKVALGGNPKRTYGKQNQAPSTRMSMPSIIRDLFERTREYMAEKEEAKRTGCENFKYDAELEAVIPAINKEIPLKIHCTQFDMITAIEIAREYDMQFSLEHAWGASIYMEEIVKSGCSICFGPVGSMHSPGECSLIDIESVVELDERGVNTCLITDAPILSIDSLLQHAGEAVRCGLPTERALRMITINPAIIMGVQDRVGTIEQGKDADIVLFRGMPARDTSARVEYTIAEGKVVYQRV